MTAIGYYALGGATTGDDVLIATYVYDVGTDFVSVLNRIGGGDGNDTLTGLDVPFTVAAATITEGSQLSGEAGNDTLNGGTGNDSLNGGSGDDVLNGNGGNDFLDGAGGANTLNGGDGDDILASDAGESNALNGGDGNDTVWFSGGTGTYDGGDDTDTLRYATGDLGTLTYSNVEVLDFNGNGIVIGSVAAFASFGAITDLIPPPHQLYMGLQGAGGTLDLSNRVAPGFSARVSEWGALTSAITITGTSADDFFSGSSYVVVLNGGEGNDTLIAGPGIDTLNGGAGNDTFKYGGGGSQGTIDGGDGIDTANMTSLGLYTFVDVEVLDIGGTNGTVAGYSSFATITDSAGAANSQIYLYLFGSGGTIDLSTRVAGLHSVHASDNGLGAAVTVTGSVNDDEISGSAFDDTLDGAAGNDSLNGGSGGNDTASYAAAAAGVTVSLGFGGPQDTIGAGTDTLGGFENLTGSAFNDHLTGDGGANILSGAGGDDTLQSGAGNDTLSGGSGNDTLEGGAGNDSLSGNTGNDTVSYASAGSAVTVDLTIGGPQDTLGAGIDTFSSIENVEGSGFDDTLTGTGGNNTLTGGAGNDNLGGGAGNDTLAGGAGNDSLDGAGGIDTASYADAAAGVTVSLTVAGAQNTIGAGLDTLSGFENVIGSSFGDILTGDGGDNTLQAGDGDDLLVGGNGNDTLNGGNGVDTASYAAAGSGITLSLSVAGAQDSGGAGLDTLAGIDSLVGSAFADTLTGNSGVNALTGGNGNDTLDGKTGADAMEGGDGNDTYFVDNADDTVIEAANKGIDTVITTLISYTLGKQVENLRHEGGGRFKGVGNNNANTLTGGTGDDTLMGSLGNDVLDGQAGSDTASYASATVGVTVTLGIASPQDTAGAGFDTLISFENLTGSDYADTLTGDTAANTLDGSDGNDMLHGGDAGDKLTGGAGNDTLDGGAGADMLSGGGGDDLYLVDDAGDKVVEAANKGTDTVSTNLASLTLAGNVENLIYTGAAAFNGTGNALANMLTGGAGDDNLIGAQGADALRGEAGTDLASYATAKTGVVASLSNPGSNTGDAAGDSYDLIEGLRGSKYADTLTGDGGDNLLFGNGGLDTLTGGAGGDTFAFDQALSPRNLTTVTDFTVGIDVIRLSLAIFAAAGPAGTLSANAYYAGSAAHDSDDRIIYNPLDGKLMYDADGAGGTAAKTFASLGPGLALSAGDFRLA